MCPRPLLAQRQQLTSLPGDLTFHSRAGSQAHAITTSQGTNGASHSRLRATQCVGSSRPPGARGIHVHESAPPAE